MEEVVRRIAGWMRAAGDLTEDQEEVVGYALLHLLLSVASTAGILLLSWGLRVFVPGVLCAAAAASLRLMSGGAHYSSPGRCTLMAVLTFPSLAWVAARIPDTLVGPCAGPAMAFTMACVLLYSPVASENKPLPPSRRPVFRTAGFVVALAWAAVMLYVTGAEHPALTAAISAGLAWQALSLTPTGRLVYHRLDQALQLRR